MGISDLFAIFDSEIILLGDRRILAGHYRPLMARAQRHHSVNGKSKVGWLSRHHLTDIVTVLQRHGGV